VSGSQHQNANTVPVLAVWDCSISLRRQDDTGSYECTEAPGWVLPTRKLRAWSCVSKKDESDLPRQAVNSRASSRPLKRGNKFDLYDIAAVSCSICVESSHVKATLILATFGRQFCDHMCLPSKSS
jgi:hypothetical protein